jgi:hypothetical protein
MMGKIPFPLPDHDSGILTNPPYFDFILVPKGVICIGFFGCFGYL